jgi:hypothetical protein
MGCPQKIADFGLKNPISDKAGHVFHPQKAHLRSSFYKIFAPQLLPSAICVSERVPTPELSRSGLGIGPGQIGLKYPPKSPILGLKNPILGQGNPKVLP